MYSSYIYIYVYNIKQKIKQVPIARISLCKSLLFSFSSFRFSLFGNFMFFSKINLSDGFEDFAYTSAKSLRNSF